MLKDGFAGCTPAVRRPTYKPQKGRQRFPVGADSISARGGSRRRALSSGCGPGMPGPYRVAIVPGGMTFLRAMRRAACPQAAADVCHSGKVRGSPPHIQTAKGAAAISRRGGFYIRPGWFPQAGAFVRLRAGHARPLQGCNSPGRDDLFADVCHSGKVRGSPL